MTDWVTTLVPPISLIAGSVLTLSGQLWIDRRTQHREERARREDFRIKNFEYQRGVLTEMQEMLADFEQSVTTERLRRSEEYEYFDSRPTKEIGDIAMTVAEQLSKLQQNMDSLKGKATRADRRKIEGETKELLGMMEKFSGATEAFHATSAEVLKMRLPFMQGYLKFMREFRLYMYRSCSNRVLEAGEEYIQAVGEWNSRVVSKHIDQYDGRIQSAAFELNRAMANVLFNGPFAES
jgi:hypothetical protein